MMKNGELQLKIFNFRYQGYVTIWGYKQNRIELEKVYQES